MNVKDLIKQLRKLPQDASVAILDTKRSNHYADDEPSSEGVYELDEVFLMGPEDIPDGAAPWVAISFDNRDFDEDEQRKKDRKR